MTKFHNSSNI